MLRHTQRFNSSPTSFHVSFDANKLYPSVYVPEGIEILATKLRYDRKLHERTGLTRKELLTLTELCVSEPYFECELGTYIQDEGAPMGGPLTDLLADLIIENKIEKTIAHHPKWGPLVDWIRKADDTFMEWTNSMEELQLFYSFLNSLHPKIQWSMEISKNNQISFLDVLVIKNGSEILTSVYRKLSASNRYIHYTSAHPWKDKTAAMKFLKARALDYCSPQFLDAELTFLKQTFLLNGYPSHIIDRFIHNRPDFPNLQSDNDNQNTNQGFLAPFHPAATRLFRTLNKKFNIKPIFTSTPSLANHLLKRRPPTKAIHKPGAVYAIPCECDLFYIGETKRTAAIRTNEEKAACLRCDRGTLSFSNNSKNDLGLTLHHKVTQHNFKFDDTQILTIETNWHKRKLLEGLYIEANKHCLVNLKSGSKVDNCWTPLIHAIPALKLMTTLKNSKNQSHRSANSQNQAPSLDLGIQNVESI